MEILSMSKSFFSKLFKRSSVRPVLNQALANRSLRMEPLEERQLLSVTTAEYSAIRTEYSDFGLSENMSNVNIIEINASNLSCTSLKAAIAEAGTTTKDDLIVIRTTEESNVITLGNQPIHVSIDSAQFGNVAIVSLGKAYLQLANQGVVMHVDSGNLFLGGMTFKGMYGIDQTLSPRQLLEVSSTANVAMKEVFFLTEQNAVETNPASALYSSAGMNDSLSSPTALNENVYYSVEVPLGGSEWGYVTGLTAEQIQADNGNELPLDGYTGYKYINNLSNISSIFKDAEKSKYTNEDNYCWAATCSNMLAYSGWGNVSSGVVDSDRDGIDEDDIYDYYTSYYNNVCYNTLHFQKNLSKIRKLV